MDIVSRYTHTFLWLQQYDEGLHGELNKARSSFNTDYIVPCLGDQLLEDKDNHGHPMRPHIVLFWGKCTHVS